MHIYASATYPLSIMLIGLTLNFEFDLKFNLDNVKLTLHFSIIYIRPIE